MSKNSSREFWTTIAREYYQDNYKEVKNYPSLLIRHNYVLELFDMDNGNILDVGCGPGEMIVELIKRGCNVCGVDIANGMIEVAKENVLSKYPHTEVNFQCGNIESLNFEDSVFDGIICTGVLEYLIRDERALTELNRVLKKDGILIISVRNKACPARLFDFAIDRIKECMLGVTILKKIVKLIKGRVDSEIAYTRYRKHCPWSIDKKLKQYGFEKADYRFFHFYPFFAVFEKIFRKFFVKTGLKMEVLSHTRLGWLGSGYIIKARKVFDLSDRR